MIPRMTSAPRGLFTATVVSNTSLCREHYRLTVRVADFPPSAPGQFVQLNCRDESIGQVEHEFDWSPQTRPQIVGQEFLGQDAFLRRPFSIAGRRDLSDGVCEIDVIGREVGPGTRFLAHLEPGETLSVAGPLGNTFTLPEPNGIALLVGGGVGIPPMIYVAQALAARATDKPARAVAFAGALTRELMSLTVDESIAAPSPRLTDASSRQLTALYNVAEFAQFGVPAVLTTDDGSLGMKGFVTQALERYLDEWITDNADRARTTIYTCGPEGMMKAVQAIGARRNVRVQVAVERAMACGMGTCQSCCIRVKKPDPTQPPLAGQDWCYRLACTDGPVFSGDELLW
jgi:dihydroorotate dehydrogenase electron transfer subunit